MIGSDGEDGPRALCIPIEALAAKGADVEAMLRDIPAHPYRQRCIDRRRPRHERRASTP